MSAAVAAAKASGELPANLDDERFLQAIFMMADGFFCGRAADPNFDTESAAETLFAAMRGLAQVLLLPASDRAQPGLLREPSPCPCHPFRAWRP
jgi:hypothetical protein